jgi:hypothetical protein
MSFWETSAGKVTGTSDSAFIKSFKTIPDGTTALARINDFKYGGYNGEKYLQINWVLIEGDFAGKHIFHKLRVFDNDGKKRLRALNMFMYIHKLFGIRPAGNEAPTERELMQFTGKQAGLKIRETEQNEEGKQYNWVSEVHDEKGFESETAVNTVVTHVNRPKNNIAHGDELWTQKLDDNNIPF